MSGEAQKRAELPTVELSEVRETAVSRFGRPEDFGERICLPVYIDRWVSGETVSVLVCRLSFPRSEYYKSALSLADAKPFSVYDFTTLPPTDRLVN